MEQNSIFAKIFFKFSSLAMLLWSVGMTVFFVFINKLYKAGEKAVVFYPNLILNTAFTLAAVVLFCYIYNKIKILQRYKKMFLCVISFAYIIYYGAQIPFSPEHDALEMSNFLANLLNGTPFENFQLAYLTFTATNKLTMYFYYPLVKLFGDVKTGVLIQNYFMLYSSVLFIAFACKRMFGRKYFEPALAVSTVLAPFMLLTGAYIYLPAVFFAAMTTFFYFGDKQYQKVVSYFGCGILLVLRPLSLGWLLVVIAFDCIYTLIKKEKILKMLLELLILGICILTVNKAIGIFFYKTGLHPYPNLANNATVWALELGTRYHDSTVGLCTYTPYYPVFEDEIPQKMKKIWNLYENNNPADYALVKETQKEAMELIKTRTMTTILDTKAHFFDFIIKKAYNLFCDGYIPYYYRATVTNGNTNELYNNFHDKFFLYFNMLLLGFFAAQLCAAGRFFLKKKSYTRSDFRLLAMSAGVFATFILLILLTEVMKKYAFDVYVPLILGISVIVKKAVDILENLKLNIAVFIVAFIAMLFGGSYTYNKKNIAAFKNGICRIGYEEISFEFNTDTQGKGYQIQTVDGEIINISGLDRLTIKAPEDAARVFNILTPSGSRYMIYREN